MIVIVAKAAGKTTVIGTYKGKKYKCKITVKKKPENQVKDDPKLNATEVDLYSKGGSYADLEPKDSKYINQFQFKDTYYLVTTGVKEPRPRSYVVAKIETDDIEAYCKGKGVPWVAVK